MFASYRFSACKIASKWFWVLNLHFLRVPLGMSVLQLSQKWSTPTLFSKQWKDLHAEVLRYGTRTSFPLIFRRVMPVGVVTLPFQFLWCFSGQPHCEPWEIDSCSRSLGSVHFREFLFRERSWFHSFQPFAHSFEFAGRDNNEFSIACVQWLRVSLMVSKFSFPRSRYWVKDLSANSLIWRVMSEK